jgi:hypothetical protein
MAATTHALALRYLLALSMDIHAAALMDDGGALLASAPAPLPGRAGDLARALALETLSLSDGAALGDAAQGAGVARGRVVELDASCEEGGVFVVRDLGMAMVCVTGRAVLPGLIFHDMHAVLNDIERAAGQGDLRAAAGGRAP